MYCAGCISGKYTVLPYLYDYYVYNDDDADDGIFRFKRIYEAYTHETVMHKVFYFILFLFCNKQTNKMGEHRGE